MLMRRMKVPTIQSIRQSLVLVFLSTASLAASQPTNGTNIFAPASTPAKEIAHLSIFVLAITGIIFLVVFTLLVYSIVKFRGRSVDAGSEPAQVYGSTQIEMAWTIIPILIVVVLFLATARVIHAVQDASQPANAVEVTAIGHQYWWEHLAGCKWDSDTESVHRTKIRCTDAAGRRATRRRWSS